MLWFGLSEIKGIQRASSFKNILCYGSAQAVKV